MLTSHDSTAEQSCHFLPPLDVLPQLCRFALSPREWLSQPCSSRHIFSSCINHWYLGTSFQFSQFNLVSLYYLCFHIACFSQLPLLTAYISLPYAPFSFLYFLPTHASLHECWMQDPAQNLSKSHTLKKRKKQTNKTEKENKEQQHLIWQSPAAACKQLRAPQTTGKEGQFLLFSSNKLPY